MDSPIMPRLRTSKESNSLAKSKLRGPVKYSPFENLDNGSLSEIRRFDVRTFGYIYRSCSHIPYNSGKKDFFEKTGRESFEVFRYSFKIPGNDNEYQVMWDYNVGLVRMTPFFKCCNYGKTMPAKMLSLNPGLKEITHSITGGSIAAQGYWMPYQCARAVCATFCFRISGALIPIFGPSFPAECIHPESAEFGRMIINPQLVIEATREAEIARRLHSNTASSGINGATSFPRRERSMPGSPYALEDRSLQFRPRLMCDSVWSLEPDMESHHSAPNSASSSGSGLHGYMITSRPSSSWTPANIPGPQYDPYHGTNPWLSAVPRIAPPQPQNNYSGPSWAGSKRRFGYEDSEYAYEGSASPNASMTSAAMTDSPLPSPPRDRAGLEGPRLGPDNAQKNAAMLLLGLSMREQNTRTPSSSGGVTNPNSLEYLITDEHRRKRQRATSF
ncbi:Fc.00g088900.m01.CDS01 [Cosmosporella sp. VM-42]